MGVGLWGFRVWGLGKLLQGELGMKGCPEAAQELGRHPGNLHG